MTDLITKESVINEVSRFKGYLDDDMIFRIQTAIKRLPAADAVPIEFIKSEIARMKEGANQHYPECVVYAEDLEVLISEWEGSKKRYAID